MCITAWSVCVELHFNLGLKIEEWTESRTRLCKQCSLVCRLLSSVKCQNDVLQLRSVGCSTVHWNGITVFKQCIIAVKCCFYSNDSAILSFSIVWKSFKNEKLSRPWGVRKVNCSLVWSGWEFSTVHSLHGITVKSEQWIALQWVAMSGQYTTVHYSLSSGLS